MSSPLRPNRRGWRRVYILCGNRRSYAVGHGPHRPFLARGLHSCVIRRRTHRGRSWAAHRSGPSADRDLGDGRARRRRLDHWWLDRSPYLRPPLRSRAPHLRCWSRPSDLDRRGTQKRLLKFLPHPNLIASSLGIVWQRSLAAKMVIATIVSDTASRGVRHKRWCASSSDATRQPGRRAAHSQERYRGRS